MKNPRRWGQEVCLQKEKAIAMIAWILTMQDCGLSITLQQLKMKVT